MAERLAAKYGAALGIPDLKLSSAGTRALVDQPIHRHARRVLELRGGDSSNFSSRQFTAKQASQADLILTMTLAHREAVLELAPRTLKRVFTLGEAARLAERADVRDLQELAHFRCELERDDFDDVADPIGHELDAFEACGSQIADLVQPVLELCRRRVLH